MLQKSSISRTAEVFFLNPTKAHYLMDISRKIGVAHTSVKKSLTKLVNLGLIEEKKEKKGTRIFPVYKAKKEPAFKKYKKLYNLSSVMESKLVEFIEEKLTPRCIVLFGSYSRGEDTEDSDIDIYVECKKEDLSLRKFEKNLGRKIELHFNESFASYPKELKNNIINGIVLSGFLEGYK